MTRIKNLVDQALDMSRRARMERAREMGFDTERVLFHGTNQDFAEFQRSEDGSFGAWLTDSPEYANRYTAGGRYRDGRRARRGRAIYPVRTAINNPLDLRAAGIDVQEGNITLPELAERAGFRFDEDDARRAAQRLVDADPDAFGDSLDPLYDAESYYSQPRTVWSWMDDPFVRETLLEQGFDGVATTEAGTNTMMALRPQDIRSVNAALWLRKRLRRARAQRLPKACWTCLAVRAWSVRGRWGLIRIGCCFTGRARTLMLLTPTCPGLARMLVRLSRRSAGWSTLPTCIELASEAGTTDKTRT
jgi:hypothetical protein